MRWGKWVGWDGMKDGCQIIVKNMLITGEIVAAHEIPMWNLGCSKVVVVVVVVLLLLMVIDK